MEQKRETLVQWYIRNTEDPMWQSVPFPTQEDAQQAIDETELFKTHAPVCVSFPVSFDPKVMDYMARSWVAEQYENVSIGHWTTEECWQSIEEDHHGGRAGFIIMSLLSRPYTR